MFGKWRILKITLARMIVLLILILVVLQVLHMSLLTRLEAKFVTIHRRDAISGDAEVRHTIRSLVSNMKISLLNSPVLDSSGSYSVISNILTPTSYGTLNAPLVTLATQTSVNNLDNLISLSEQWNGPISVAIFSYSDNVLQALETIAYLHLCYPTIAKSTSFHIIHPLDQPPVNFISRIQKNNDSCELSINTLIYAATENYEIKSMKYPNNLLRNIAIRYSLTDFIYLVDVDMQPSRNLSAQFTDFYKRQSKLDTLEKTAYVIPTFESKELNEVPTGKTKLISEWDAENIRPFYFDACWKCQRNTDYDAWRKDFENTMHIIKYIEWKDPWEPFYIIRRDLPLYDERFKQYGFNRISQVGVVLWRVLF